MLKNALEYSRTRQKRQEFAAALAHLHQQPESLKRQLHVSAVGSQIESLDLELAQYEASNASQPD